LIEVDVCVILLVLWTILLFGGGHKAENISENQSQEITYTNQII